MGSKWKKSEEQFLIDNYQNIKAEDLGKKLSRTKVAIKNKVKKLGLKLTSDSVEKRYKNRKQKYKIDANFFIHPKDDLIAGYILGFIWADGYISKKSNAISLYISSQDMKDIEHLFMLSGEWRLYHKKQKKGKNLSRILCHCFEFHEFLERNEYKEKSLKSPNLILKHKSENYKIGFWRGFIDGDGCYHLNKHKRKKTIQLSGSKEQDWSAYTEMLTTLGCRFSIRKSKRWSNVVTTDAKSLLRLIDYIYNNKYDGVGLKRKFLKAKEMKKYIKERMIKNSRYYK